jgi:hypothetical protein
MEAPYAQLCLAIADCFASKFQPIFDPLRRAGRDAARSDFDFWPVNKDSWRGAIQERRWQGLAFFRLASLRLQERLSAD